MPNSIKKYLVLFSEESKGKYEYLIHDLHQFQDVSNVKFNLNDIDINTTFFWIVNTRNELIKAIEYDHGCIPIGSYLLSLYIKQQNCNQNKMKMFDILKVIQTIMKNCKITLTQLKNEKV